MTIMTNDTDPAADGPVIDHEPAPAATSSRRPLPKNAVWFAAAIVAVLLSATAGAWLYTASGLEIFGSATSDRLAALETRLSQLEQRSGEQAAQAQALADRIDGLGAQMEGLAGDGARLAAVEAKQAALAKGLEALQTRPVAEAGNAAASEEVAQLKSELATLKQQIASPSPVPTSLAPEREALAAELEKIAESLKPQPVQATTPETNSWSGWAMAQLSRYYTVRPAGTALAEDLARLARAQDINGAVRLVREQASVPPSLADWMMRADAFIAKQVAP